MEERRERGHDTGEMIYTNIEGSGIGDMSSKVVSKLTGETASKLAIKQQKNLSKKGQKKLLKKLVNLSVKKFMISFHLKVKNLKN